MALKLALYRAQSSEQHVSDSGLSAKVFRAVGKHLDDEVIFSHFTVPHKSPHGGDGLIGGVVLCPGAVVSVLFAHLVHLHGHAILAITRKTGCCPSRCAIFWGTERQRSCVPVYTTGGDRGAGHANPVG